MPSLPLREIRIHHGPYPVATPSEDHPITNPLSLLLCRYPLGAYLSNPNFAIIHSRPFAHDSFTDPLYAFLTSGSEAPISRPTRSGAQTFWMKTYSENKGLLEVLEANGVLRRTGETHKQGFVELIAVETCLGEGEWAEVCANQMCGRREQIGDDKGRMKKCVRCKDAFYCGVDCQKADWGMHKQRCGTLKEAKGDRAAVSGDETG
jgi:hypothetical protein